jgi:hypothetical protein
MKKIHSLFVVMAILLTTTSFSQTVIENTQDLSKNSVNGYFYDATQNSDNGNIEVIYKFKKSSKDADASYETYSFDKNLKFIKAEETKANVTDKTPYSKTFVYATVGGCSSFDVLSMKLALTKRTYNYAWNADKKRFYGKRTENITITPENDAKRAYSGYAAYRENETGKMMVLTSSETKGDDKKIKKDFILLEVKIDLTTREIELPLEPSQLVYCDIAKSQNIVSAEDDNDGLTLDNGDMIFVFAPTFNKLSSIDYKKYTYLRIDKNGFIKENIKFDAPSPNLIITCLQQSNDGSVYMSGSYTSDPKSFDLLYKEYSPLENPCFPDAANYRMSTYETKTEKMLMSYFSMLKVKDGKMEWIKNTAISDFPKFLKTPPKQKGATSYTGKRFLIEYFNVSDNGDIFISGQLLGRVKIGESMVKSFKEVICLQINNTGDIKAQYGIESPTILEKLNTLFPISQEFITANNGSILYWNLMEVKTIKGYASFYDAYNGSPSFYANYCPSMVKINTTTNQIEDYKIIGDRKYLLNKTVPYIFNKSENSIIYIGSDKEKKLWLAKYTMN